MRRMAVSFIMIVMAILLASSAFAAGPWKGQVIDIETKEALEGAVVVAVWQRAWRTASGAVSDVYKVKEVVTDKDGKFEMTSYTPINLLPLLTYMKEPEFIIYKPGYGSLQMVIGDYLTGDREKAPYSGKMLFFNIKISPGVIELQRLKTREERLKTMPGHITGAIDKTPILNKLMDEEDKALGIK